MFETKAFISQNVRIELVFKRDNNKYIDPYT